VPLLITLYVIVLVSDQKNAAPGSRQVSKWSCNRLPIVKGWAMVSILPQGIPERIAASIATFELPSDCGY